MTDEPIDEIARQLKDADWGKDKDDPTTLYEELRRANSAFREVSEMIHTALTQWFETIKDLAARVEALEDSAPGKDTVVSATALEPDAKDARG